MNEWMFDYPENDCISGLFLLNKDISQLWYELGHIHKKIWFYEESIFLMSQLHNCIPKYLSFVHCFMCVPKYLTIAQFLPNSSSLFRLGKLLVTLNHIWISIMYISLIHLALLKYSICIWCENYPTCKRV